MQYKYNYKSTTISKKEVSRVHVQTPTLILSTWTYSHR